MLLMSQDRNDLYETGPGTHVWRNGKNLYIENGPGAQAFRIGAYDTKEAAERELSRLCVLWDGNMVSVSREEGREQD